MTRPDGNAVLLETVGGRLRTLRTKRRRQQAEVADALGISAGTLSNYETGKRAIPLGVLIGLARLYGVRLSAIVNERD